MDVTGCLQGVAALRSGQPIPGFAPRDPTFSSWDTGAAHFVHRARPGAPFDLICWPAEALRGAADADAASAKQVASAAAARTSPADPAPFRGAVFFASGLFSYAGEWGAPMAELSAALPEFDVYYLTQSGMCDARAPGAAAVTDEEQMECCVAVARQCRARTLRRFNLARSGAAAAGGAGGEGADAAAGRGDSDAGASDDEPKFLVVGYSKGSQDSIRIARLLMQDEVAERQALGGSATVAGVTSAGVAWGPPGAVVVQTHWQLLAPIFAGLDFPGANGAVKAILNSRNCWRPAVYLFWPALRAKVNKTMSFILNEPDTFRTLLWTGAFDQLAKEMFDNTGKMKYDVDSPMTCEVTGQRYHVSDVMQSYRKLGRLSVVVAQHDRFTSDKVISFLLAQAGEHNCSVVVAEHDIRKVPGRSEFREAIVKAAVGN